MFVLSDTASVMPSYFSLEIVEGVASGPTGHWGPELSEALQFVRKVDAENFQKYFLRHILNIVVKEA